MAWGSKSNDTAPAVRGSNGMSFLGGEVVVHGNIQGGGDLHIDAEINGDVSGKMIIIGANGRVRGNVMAERATVAGAVEGTISAETLVIEKTARIQGDLSYANVSIDTGALVEGRLTQRGAPVAAPGELKLVNAAD
jgi:cytoskeletal protein CcmA (bactofilin family)